MDLFFDVWSELKWDYELTRWVKLTIAGIEFRIYSEGKLIVLLKSDNLEDRDYVYLLAARDLVNWTIRNYDHASRSARKELTWTEKLNELLSADIVDNQS